MASADTPEKSGYTGGPAIAQPKLDLARARLEEGTYPDLPTSSATTSSPGSPTMPPSATSARLRGDAAFEAILDERLTRPTWELIDRYGRMLAYLAPWFDSGGSQRGTVPSAGASTSTWANGWAAPFVIYPSLPSDTDLNLPVDEARDAWDQKRGAWDEFGAEVFLRYEYRLCIKRADTGPGDGLAAAFQRAVSTFAR